MPLYLNSKVGSQVKKLNRLNLMVALFWPNNKTRFSNKIMFHIWSRSLLLLLFSGKSSSGNEAMRVLYYIWYIFGIGKNWFDIETTIQRMYIRCRRKARILFSSFTVIYKNMYHGMNEVLAIYFLFIPIIPFVLSVGCCLGSGVLICMCVYLFF